MPSQRAVAILDILKQATVRMQPPAATSIVEEYGRNPYLVLISCILSLRTKDTTSLPASRRLFVEGAQTPDQMCNLSPDTIEKLIYPVGFYRTKARTIIKISSILCEKFDGQVPSEEEELLSLPGVGRKTMNLVRAEGFGLPAICVDVHVHRIANRLGIIKTKTPLETEMALRELLPQNYWRECNRLLVIWGQNICVPITPFCSQCAVFQQCDRIGVTRSR